MNPICIHGPGITGTLRLDNPIGKSIYPARVYQSAINPPHVDSKLTISDVPDPVQAFRDMCESPAPNLRYGCRMKEMPDGLWDVYDRDGKIPLDNDLTWIEDVLSADESRYGVFATEHLAFAALNHPDTPPPPGWKEPEGRCQECGVVGGHQSLCNQKPKAKHTGKDHDDLCTCPECCPYPKQPGTGLRAAKDVAIDMRLAVREGRLLHPMLTADRRATLDHFCEWWRTTGHLEHCGVDACLAAYKKEFLS